MVRCSTMEMIFHDKQQYIHIYKSLVNMMVNYHVVAGKYGYYQWFLATGLSMADS